MNPIVLVATKDADFSLFLTHILASGGFRALPIAPDIKELEMNIDASKAVILDSTDIDPALQLCRKARSRRKTANFAMMAFIRPQHAGYYLGFLRSGADECVLRPLSPDLILYGLRASIERRTRPLVASSHEQCEEIGALWLDRSTRMLRGRFGKAALSPIEYKILRRMLASPERVLTRRDLILAAWPPGQHVEDKTVDAHISNIRKAVLKASGEKMIETVRSSGFIVSLRKT